MSNQNPNAFLMATIAAAGEGNDYSDRFLEGEHIVALNNIGPEDSQDHGQFVSVDFVVLESTVPNYAGKECGEAFFINKSDKEGGKGAKQRMFGVGKAAVASLGGNPDDPTPAALANGQVATAGAVLVQNTLGEMCGPGSPWRGLILRAHATKKIGKNSKKEYVAVRYSPVPQNAQQIGEMRKRIEAAAAAAPPAVATNVIQGQPTAFGQAQPVAQPQYAQQPMVAAPAPMIAAQPMVAAPQGGFIQQQQVAVPAAAPVAAPFGGTSLLGR